VEGKEPAKGNGRPSVGKKELFCLINSYRRRTCRRKESSYAFVGAPSERGGKDKLMTPSGEEEGGKNVLPTRQQIWREFRNLTRVLSWGRLRRKWESGGKGRNSEKPTQQAYKCTIRIKNTLQTGRGRKKRDCEGRIIKQGTGKIVRGIPSF